MALAALQIAGSGRIAVGVTCGAEMGKQALARESTRYNGNVGLVMVRTVCCETYKCSGTRCSSCPNRPENKRAVEMFLQSSTSMSLGRRLGSRPHQEYIGLQETAG